MLFDLEWLHYFPTTLLPSGEKTISMSRDLNPGELAPQANALPFQHGLLGMKEHYEQSLVMNRMASLSSSGWPNILTKRGQFCTLGIATGIYACFRVILAIGPFSKIAPTKSLISWALRSSKNTIVASKICPKGSKGLYLVTQVQSGL